MASTKCMRILGIVDVTSPHAHKWANAFCSRGHALRLVSWRPFLERPRELCPGIEVADWSLPEFHLKRAWLTLGAIRRLRKEAQQFRPDLVQVIFLGPPAWYAWLAGLKPLVVWVMGGDIHPTGWQPGSRRERFLMPRCVSRVDGLVAWSSRLLATAGQWVRPGTPRLVVNGGVDLERFRPGDRPALRRHLGLPEDGFLVLVPRLLWPRHHADQVIEAFNALGARVETARLAILWYGAHHFPDFARRIEGAIRASPLSERITIVRQVPHAEMHHYFAAADCSVSLSDMDGTPMTVLESVACGAPAVIYDLPDYDAEILRDGETVLRVPPGDTQALTRALERLATDRPLRERIAGEGRATVADRADYLKEMDRLQAFYTSLV